MARCTASRKYFCVLTSPRIFPNGPKDLHPDLHIPTPGRVQYYRAEALIFVPNEIKSQLRFPKAYATS